MSKIKMTILLCILSLLIVSCSHGLQANQVPINRNVAIMIAAASVPPDVIGEASVVTAWDDSKWIVHFLLSNNKTVTKGEIGWPESANNTFVNQGMLPAGSYRLLSFGIDRKTGAVLFREASDSVLLGGIGTWNTEPPERVSLPLWSAIASGIGGLVIGGMTVGLVMHRKRVAA